MNIDYFSNRKNDYYYYSFSFSILRKKPVFFTTKNKLNWTEQSGFNFES